MEFVEVASVNDLDDGQMVGFEVDGTRILLAKVEGEFFAIGAICTHERSNLDEGALLGHVVYCPLHYSAFDVRSGAVLGPPAECAEPVYEVRVEDGKVLVAMQPLDSAAPAAPPAPPAATPAPPAETAAPPAETAVPPAETAVPPAETAAPPAETAAPPAETAAPPAETAAPPLDSPTRERVALLIGQIESNLAELRTIVVEGAPPPDSPPSHTVPPPPNSGAPAPDAVAPSPDAVEPPPDPGAPPTATPAAGASKAAEPAAGSSEAWSLQRPRFMGRIATSARYLPVALAIPGGVVALLVLTSAVLLEDGPAIPDGDILFEHFIGHGWIDIFVLSLVGVIGVVAATGLRRFYKGLQATVPAGIPRKPLRGALLGTAREVVTHDGFDGWTTLEVRRGSHLAMFYGFLGLLAATTGAALYTEIFPLLGIEWQGNELSLPLWDPVKIIGNVGGIALLIGLAQTFPALLRRPRPAGKSTYSDLFFPGLLALTAVTGFLTEILRYAGVRMAYPAYAVHLVFVFALFVYFPFSKFAHAMYYPAGFTFARQIGGRKRPSKLAPTVSRRASDDAKV